MSELKLTHSEYKAEGIRIACSNSEGVEIGHVYIYCILNEPRQKPYAFLEDLFVEETERSKGVGNQILEEAIRVARERGCYKLWGTSRFSREDVHAWYERKGFEKHGYEFRMDLN